MKASEVSTYWIARDYNGQLWLHLAEKPRREGWTWQSSKYIQISRSEYPEVTWEGNPQKVKLQKA